MHQIVIIIAKYFIGISLLVTALLWLRLSTPEKKRFVVLAVLGAALSLVLAKIGNKLYTDPRPFVVGHFTPYFSHGADNGFPSDHTLLASFLAFTVWFYNRKVAAGLFVLALLIGFSRVVAGVHHVVDILGSVLFAAIGVLLANLLINAFMKRQTDKAAAADTNKPPLPDSK